MKQAAPDADPARICPDKWKLGQTAGESSEVPGPGWTEGGVVMGMMVLGRGRARKVPQVALSTLEPHALPALAALGLEPREPGGGPGGPISWEER